MKIIPCTQGSQDWFEARSGKVTASEVINALAFLKRGDKKGGDTAARAAYKAQIVAETLTGAPSMDGFLSSYMQHGTETEPFARAAYEVRYDVSVDQVGFIVHSSIERSGASPDGLVGHEGCVEIKCPKTTTHIDYMLARELPCEYEPQVMWVLACTGRKWCDFVSFDPRLPPRHQMFCKRVQRDEARIAEMEAGVIQFLSEADAMIAQMDVLNPELPAPPRKPVPEDLAGITDEDISWILNQQLGRMNAHQ